MSVPLIMLSGGHPEMGMDYGRQMTQYESHTLGDVSMPLLRRAEAATS